MTPCQGTRLDAAIWVLANRKAKLQRFKEKGGKRDRTRVDTVDGQEEEGSPRCCWECCPRTVRISYRGHPAGDDGCDRDCVYGIRAYGLGGQRRYSCLQTKRLPRKVMFEEGDV